MFALLAVGCAAAPPPPPVAADAAPTASPTSPGEVEEADDGDRSDTSEDQSSAEPPSAKCNGCEDDACYASCEALCDKGDKDACGPVLQHLDGKEHELAATTEGKTGAALEAIEKQSAAARAKTLRYAKHGCEVGAPGACYTFGSLAWSGQAGDASAAKYPVSFAAFKKGCELGDMMSCSSLGEHYLAGEGTAKDAGKAAEAWGRSCLNNRYGCSDLKKLIVQKNKQALVALDAIKKACASIDSKSLIRTACDAQKQVESK